MVGATEQYKLCPKTKQKRTAFVKFYDERGINSVKQLVSVEDLCSFDFRFNEYVIGEDEDKRDIYLNACSDIV